MGSGSCSLVRRQTLSGDRPRRSTPKRRHERPARSSGQRSSRYSRRKSASIRSKRSKRMRSSWSPPAEEAAHSHAGAQQPVQLAVFEDRLQKFDDDPGLRLLVEPAVEPRLHAAENRERGRLAAAPVGRAAVAERDRLSLLVSDLEVTRRHQAPSVLVTRPLTSMS